MKIPGMGEVKNSYVAIGGGGMVLVLVYAGYRYKKQKATADAAAAASNAASAGDGTATVDSTGAGANGIDPSTGIPYSEESAYGSTYGGIDPATGLPYYDETSGTTSTGTTFTTNSQWIQQAESDAQNLFNATYALAASAVGKYISQTSAGLLPAEYLLMQQILGELGQPPDGTFRLIQASSTSGTTTGTTGTPASNSLANSVGKVVILNSNVQSFGNAQQLAAHFGEGMPELEQYNPGLTPGQTSGVVKVPVLITSATTLASLAQKFEESEENIAQQLSSQGIV